MVAIIMMIGLMFFFIGFFFEKAVRLAAAEWRAVGKEIEDERY